MSVNRPGIFICEATSFLSSSSDHGRFKLGSSCAPKKKRRILNRDSGFKFQLLHAQEHGLSSSFLRRALACHKGNESTSTGEKSTIAGDQRPYHHLAGESHRGKVVVSALDRRPAGKMFRDDGPTPRYLVVNQLPRLSAMIHCQFHQQGCSSARVPQWPMSIQSRKRVCGEARVQCADARV